jgi:uncharacterized protein (DUF983 family)
MSHPCPECGGAVHIHKDDHENAVRIITIVAVGMVAVAALLVALGIARP